MQLRHIAEVLCIALLAASIIHPLKAAASCLLAQAMFRGHLSRGSLPEKSHLYSNVCVAGIGSWSAVIRPTTLCVLPTLPRLSQGAVHKYLLFWQVIVFTVKWRIPIVYLAVCPVMDGPKTMSTQATRKETSRTTWHCFYSCHAQTLVTLDNSFNAIQFNSMQYNAIQWSRTDKHQLKTKPKSPWQRKQLVTLRRANPLGVPMTTTMHTEPQKHLQLPKPQRNSTSISYTWA